MKRKKHQKNEEKICKKTHFDKKFGTKKTQNEIDLARNKMHRESNTMCTTYEEHYSKDRLFLFKVKQKFNQPQVEKVFRKLLLPTRSSLRLLLN